MRRKYVCALDSPSAIMAARQDVDIFRTVLDRLPIGAYIVDEAGKITFWNAAAEEITGHLRQEVLGHRFPNSVLMYCDQEGSILSPQAYPLAQTMHDGKSRSGEAFLQHKSGYRIPVEVRSFPVAEENGRVISAAESFRENYATPEWVEREKDLAAHGCLDEVSGLPNQAYTRSHVEACMTMWAKHHLSFGVICLQVDRLQQFREIHGAGAIHALLRVVSGTIRHSLGASTHVGRWTEDRFLIVIPGYHPYGLTKVAQDLAKLVSRSTIHWWGDVLSVKVSWGTADIQDEESPEELIAQAESSLERMSQRGNEQADAAHG